jgi:hypothetical protein
MARNSFFKIRSRNKHTLVLFDQDKFEQGGTREEFTIGERKSNFVPRVDESILVDLIPYRVEGVSRDLDDHVSGKVYLTLRSAEEEISEALEVLDSKKNTFTT